MKGSPLGGLIAVTEYIEKYKSKIDESATRSAFPEITDSETPIWRSSPSFFSMADKYVLSFMVLLIHLVFFGGEWLEAPEGEGQANFLISLLVWFVDYTGVLGFIIAMLFLTKVNHYANFSTSGGWTTSALLAVTFVPGIWKLMDIMERLGGFIGTEFTSPLPEWNYAWFLPLGAASFALMTLASLAFQRSFKYAITDKRIHLRKSFLFFDTSVHGIAFQKIENVKADPTILGRIFGFGNVHILTGSGMGIQRESMGVSVAAAPEIKEVPTGVKKIFSLLFGMISKQRERNVMASDPADCLYGIRKPMDVYRLINELIDARVPSIGVPEDQ